MRLNSPAALVLFVLAGSAAHAESITGLYNTGTSNIEGATDPNYVVTSYSGGSPPPGSAPYSTKIISTSKNTFPFPHYWATNSSDPTAAWISPDGRKTTDPHADGTYVYQTTFDINVAPGQNLYADDEGLVLAGLWSADSYADGFDVNGDGYNAQTGLPISEPQCACNDLFPFFVFIPVNDLLVGTNTITFEVANFGQRYRNLTGLYVDFDSDTALVPDGNGIPGGGSVPEPLTLSLFGAGLGVMKMLRRRKAKNGFGKSVQHFASGTASR